MIMEVLVMIVQSSRSRNKHIALTDHCLLDKIMTKIKSAKLLIYFCL